MHRKKKTYTCSNEDIKKRNNGLNRSIEIPQLYSLDKERKLGPHKALRRCLGGLLKVLCAFNLRPRPERRFFHSLLANLKIVERD